MHKVNRRTFLVGTGTTATLAALGGVVVWREGLHGHAFSLIERQFGREFATHSETKRFVPEMVKSIPAFQRLAVETYFDLEGDRLGLAEQRKRVDYYIVKSFVQSTNIIKALEEGEPFYYAGLFTPYKRPCGNMLSASNA